MPHLSHGQHIQKPLTATKMKTLKIILKKAIFMIRLKLAISEAKKMHELTKKKFYVLLFNKKPVVMSANQIRNLKKNRVISKRFDFSTLQENALFQTN